MGRAGKKSNVFSALLELGLHNDGQDSFTLGRPEPCKLDTEMFTVHPPYQGFVDSQRLLLVVEKQGEAKHHADLYLCKGCCLTAACGEIQNRRFALEVALSKKE